VKHVYLNVTLALIVIHVILALVVVTNLLQEFKQVSVNALMDSLMIMQILMNVNNVI